MSFEMCGYTIYMDEQIYKRMLPAPAPVVEVGDVTESSLTSNTGGRPSKFTPERVDTLVKWLKLGYYIDEACSMAGIHRDTYYAWLKKADEGIQEFSDFSDTIKKARAEAEGAHIMNIRKAADNGVWQASAWFLERAYPTRWGKKNPDLINEDSDEPVEFEIKYADG